MGFHLNEQRGGFIVVVLQNIFLRGTYPFLRRVVAGVFAAVFVNDGSVLCQQAVARIDNI